jgi:signal transduction histidine kinase
MSGWVREVTGKERWTARIGYWLGLAVVYTIVARLGLRMDAVAGFASPVWPVSGIALGAILLQGSWLWPGIALGAFAANVSSGAAAPVAFGIAVGNTLEAVLGAGALRCAGFRNQLARVRDVVALAGLAALASTAVSATIGVTSLFFGGLVPTERLTATWRAWWLGDVVGELVVTPLLLSLATGRRRRIPAPRRKEAMVLLLCVVGVGLFLFSPWKAAELSYARREYLVFPPLAWAALRFGVPGAALGTCLISALAIAGTALGGGPFAGGHRLAESLLAFQAFMAVVAVTILLLGAISAERNEALGKRDAFLEIVAHELRNPLSAVRMSAGMLLAQLPAGDWGQRVGKRVAVIQRATDRLVGLIQNLLDLAAIEAGRLRVEMRPADAWQVVEEAVETLRPLAEQRSQLLVHLSLGPGVEVVCDHDRIVQVLANLVGNAIKFCPEGAIITVQIERLASVVRFSVVDTGPGIASEHLPHLFRRYWQAGPEARAGSGLGLSIARGIVEAHGGSIWADSQLGNGSAFRFTLPVSAAFPPREMDPGVAGACSGRGEA